MRLNDICIFNFKCMVPNIGRKPARNLYGKKTRAIFNPLFPNKLCSKTAHSQMTYEMLKVK